ncbi:XrtV sorting system accessory protein [Bradyrhizobium sp.]|jgi:hypothetical protein|uniref:XrtV sorting system accessory protein n=1 Tax=Bradyrhizobium sp. TaxID=376 RepID=UPI003C263E80
MATIFDFVTVSCFFGLVIAFFQFTDRNTRIMLWLLPAVILLAIANQIGNSGELALATLLISASIGYAILAIRGGRRY